MKHQLLRPPNRFISITGPDAETFLQGQCSADINQLDSKHFSYGTLNTPKGRMYSLFKVTRISHGLLLSIHQATFEQVLSTLKKYAVFFKCELSEASYKAYGSDLGQEQALLSISADFEPLFNSENAINKVGNEHSTLLRLPGKECLVELWTQELPAKTIETQDALENWLAREALCGIPQLYKATLEQFILQELNLQELGAVSFKKGCYTGQEIIARMKFLGKLKKRMFLLQAEPSSSAVKPSPGASVLINNTGLETTKAGKLVRTHSLNHSQIALAVLNKELVNESSLAFISEFPDTIYKIHELSYESLIN